jgi:hypothetical protein
LTLMIPQMYGTVETTTTFDRIYGIYEAKKRAIEEGFREWGASYIAHFSHWFPWGVTIYDRFIIERPPQDPRRGAAASYGDLVQVGTDIIGEGGDSERPSRDWFQIGVVDA